MPDKPFSIYDFLSYFTPGVLTLYLAAVAIHLFLPNSMIDLTATGVSKAAAETGTVRITLPFVKPDSIQEYALLLILSYAIGHAVSYLSSVTIEKYSIWNLGYPSKYLLFKKQKNEKFTATQKRNAIPNSLAQQTWRGDTPVAWIWVITLFMAPISIFDHLIGRKFNLRNVYASPLDPGLRVALQRKIKRLLETHGGFKFPKNRPKDAAPNLEIDFFRYIYHYALERAPQHVHKMQKYVAIYGFLRTICLICVFIWWLATIELIKSYFSIQTSSSEVYRSLFVLILSTMSAIIYFLAFQKFYRRFSLEALMAAAVQCDMQE